MGVELILRNHDCEVTFRFLSEAVGEVIKVLEVSLAAKSLRRKYLTFENIHVQAVEV